MEKISGARMVVEAMRKENVEVVFGYPGGAIMNVYDEIYKQNYFEHILTRHEQAAVCAADAYARASGKVGGGYSYKWARIYKCCNWTCDSLYRLNSFSGYKWASSYNYDRNGCFSRN